MFGQISILGILFPVINLKDILKILVKAVVLTFVCIPNFMWSVSYFVWPGGVTHA